MFNTPQFCASNSGASASKPLWKVGSFSRMSGSTPFARSWWSSGEWTAPRQKNIVDEQPPKGIGSSKYIYWLVVHLQKVDSLLSLTGRYSPSLIPFFLYTLTPHEVSPNHIPMPPPCWWSWSPIPEQIETTRRCTTISYGTWLMKLSATHFGNLHHLSNLSRWYNVSERETTGTW